MERACSSVLYQRPQSNVLCSQEWLLRFLLLCASVAQELHNKLLWSPGVLQRMSSLMDAGDTHRQATRYKMFIFHSNLTTPDTGSKLEMIIISSPGMPTLESAHSPSCSFLTSQIGLPHLCSLADLLLSYTVYHHDQDRFNWKRRHKRS